MNRLKLWLYMLVLLGAGVANLFWLSKELSARALRQVDAALDAGAVALRQRERLMAAEAAAVTGVAVKDGDLLEALYAGAGQPEGKKKAKAAPAADDAAALAERQAAVEAAAKAAVEKAARTLSIALPDGAFWAAASPEWLAKNLSAAAEGPQREAAAFLRDAASGTPRRGYARVNDGLWYGVALPAGDGAALVLFLPLDAAWAAALDRDTGVDVTLAVGTPQLVTTATPELAKRLAPLAVAAHGATVGDGKAPRVKLKSPLPLELPLLFADVPATRARAEPLTGVEKAHVVLSRPTGADFAALADYQWRVLGIMAALLVVGLLLGVLVKTEIAPQIPKPLLNAASRIERGDFTVRAPVMAGQLGT
ncbi:MAG TPA: hypothetical protein VFP50_19660, partial [Anaeromyxobacteraceae bacterium]|nr:hypothetical protein [Anaeromyxobacteraceae bacterium]